MTLKGSIINVIWTKKFEHVIQEENGTVQGQQTRAQGLYLANDLVL